MREYIKDLLFFLNVKHVACFQLSSESPKQEERQLPKHIYRPVTNSIHKEEMVVNREKKILLIFLFLKIFYPSRSNAASTLEQ
jgi:hypothetical protein